MFHDVYRYFMSRLKKVKKANGQIIACNEVRAHPRHSESPGGGETRDARERRRGRRMTTRAGERRDQMARGVNSDIVCTPRGYGD